MIERNEFHPFFQILGISVITLWLYKYLKRRLTPAASKPKDDTPPGNLGFPVIGETLPFLIASKTSKGFYEFVRLRYIRYGNCFKTNIFGKTQVFVTTIEAAKFILGNDDSGCFTKKYLRTISDLLGKHSVLCATHDYHKFLRNRIGNLLSTENMASFVTLFDKLTIDTLRRWKEEKNIVVFEEALKITLKAMCLMLMSLNDESELEDLQNDVSCICDGMLAIPLKLPWTSFYRGLKAREKFLVATKRIIQERRNGLGNQDDLLQLLLGVPLTDAEIQDNLLTLIIAGQITTASAFAWMVKYLDDNQDVQNKLRDVHLQIAADDCSSGLGMQTLNGMSYASKVAKETLRMATIVSWFPMVATKDCKIEGFQVKKGWVVNVDARSIHSDGTVHRDPEIFLPSRFESLKHNPNGRFVVVCGDGEYIIYTTLAWRNRSFGSALEFAWSSDGEYAVRESTSRIKIFSKNFQEETKPYGFLAFGNGATTCLGKNLAKAMMVIFLHRLVTTYRWKVKDPDASLKAGALFPRLRSGCPICVTPL